MPNRLPLSGKQKKQDDGVIPQGLRFDVFRRDKFTCRYCGRSSPVVVLHCDHVKPRSKGGETSMENLVTACTGCNSGKRAKEDVELPQPTVEAPDGLVGLYGFTFIGDGEGYLREIQYQFKVIRSLKPDSYLVQLFSWWFGEATKVVEFKTDYLLSDECELYADIEAWKDTFQKHDVFAQAREAREDHLELVHANDLPH